MDCPHIPVFLNSSGLYDVEFRIIAACRDGTLYTFKRLGKQIGLAKKSFLIKFYQLITLEDSKRQKLQYQ
jgi:hypothetical protein